MRSRWRFLVAGLLFGLILPASATASEATAAGAGFTQIAGCISGADNLLVAIVVDESQSLLTTDPGDLRVQGITTTIDALEQLADTAGKRLNVEVSMSTFARSYEPLVDWRRLTSQSAEELRHTAQTKLPGRDAGDATDYRQALAGGQQQLESRQRQIQDPNACKVLLWFTDGALDVDEDTGAAATELCQEGGIADAVRADGIAVVAVALITPGSGVTQAQRDQLQSVAEGSGGDVTCGTSPIPSDSATGVYLPANDPAALQRLFAGAGALIAGGTQIGTSQCPSTNCPRGKYALQIDAGVAGARVLVQADHDPRVTLTSPGGQQVQLTSGESKTVDGATVSYLERGALATIDIAYSPYAQVTDRWVLAPTVPSSLSVYWFWGTQLTPITTEVMAGARNHVEFQLSDQRGDPLPTRFYGHAEAVITVDGQPIATHVTSAGVVTGDLRLGTDAVQSHLPISASLSAFSAAHGVALGPVTVTSDLAVSLPPVYPRVSPTKLDFGGVEGLASATAELTATGSRLGPTKICFDGAQVTLPGGDSRTDLVTAKPKCVALDTGETRSIRLTLAPDITADGVANGEVAIRLTAADGSEDILLNVPTTLDMERTVDETTRWLLVIALIGLAGLLPLLMLVGSNLLLGRFSRQSTSRVAVKPVRVTTSGVQPLNGAVLLDTNDFRFAGFSGSRRSGQMSIEGTTVKLRARRILSLSAPEGVATVPDGKVLVSAAPPYRLKAPNEAPVALGELDSMFVIVDASGATTGEATGTLVAVIPVAVDRQGIEERVSRLNSRPGWGKVLAEAAAATDDRVEVSADSSAAASAPSAGHVSSPVPTRGSDINSQPPLPGWAGENTFDDNADSRSSRSRMRSPKKASKPSPAAPDAKDVDDDVPPLPDFLK